MKIKLTIMITILFLIISCTKNSNKTESPEINIETKIIKETTTNKDNDIFHIDAKIPTIEGLELDFEKLIQYWKTDKIELPKTKQSKQDNYEFFYYSDFEVFKSPELKITSILYSQYTTDKHDANGLTIYYPINLRGKEKIKISDIISKDQLESLTQVLRSQVETEFRKFSIYADDKSKFEKEFEEAFKQYKYYFKNNNVVIFYDPLVIRERASGKVEFTFPIDNNTETDCPSCSQ
ncbi:DUF3298 domain-containing protein [Borrelia coriaceae]|uniref:DUF3298 domain-containing protein n=1 Tax=Borrelia coriaceae ATCC 43381 TaxID=1408429 RepID=W5STV4_9SPIR|nr:DUF3298 domain-containing protein [Borrelia coriaceae]AHH10639.1 Hypothetical protein BCO_0069100 [Borrelia coriaceae ATCC 43381]UPA16318.1 DUF3298 domain-containing protein [Borrelia coriaceae]